MNVDRSPPRPRQQRNDTAQDDPKSERRPRPPRKGIVDIKRLAEFGQASNSRYLDALASVVVETPLQSIVDPLTSPSEIGGRRVRGLRPWAGQCA